MEYILKNASKIDIDYIKKGKLYNIFNYITDISEEEIKQINNYVEENISMQLDNYKMIIVDNKIVGCFLVEQKDGDVILDEIYLDNEFRNKGIGTSIIEKIKSDNKIVYLWVYKENKNAILLYKKLNFKVIEETNTRYYMKYNN